MTSLHFSPHHKENYPSLESINTFMDNKAFLIHNVRSRDAVIFYLFHNYIYIFCTLYALPLLNNPSELLVIYTSIFENNDLPILKNSSYNAISYGLQCYNFHSSALISMTSCLGRISAVHCTFQFTYCNFSSFCSTNIIPIHIYKCPVKTHMK